MTAGSWPGLKPFGPTLKRLSETQFFLDCHRRPRTTTDCSPYHKAAGLSSEDLVSVYEHRTVRLLYRTLRVVTARFLADLPDASEGFRDQKRSCSLDCS